MTDTREDTTDIIPVTVEDDGSAVDLSNADLEYELTTEVGGGSVVISKTDADSTVYTADSDVDSELEGILPDGLDDVDLANGKFVVEIEPDEMPEVGDYAEEVRATWSSGRSFASEPRVVSVGRQSTTN